MTRLLTIATLALVILLAGGCEDKRATPDAPANQSGAPAPTSPSGSGGN
ncbi:MAG: hypothetical protein ACREX4_09515 [Gammaproteobacteria bacterium]